MSDVYLKFISPLSTPLAPTNFIATVISYYGIDLSWTDLPNETGYTLFMSRSPDTNAIIQKINLSSNITSHNDTSLLFDSQYYYWIKAYNQAGSSAFSAMVSNRTFNVKPWGLEIISVTKNSINLRWNKINNVSGYTLFKNTSNNSNEAIAIAGFSGGVTNYADTGLLPDTTYYYWIKAFNGIILSEYSEVAYATTRPMFPSVWAVFPTSFNPEKHGKAIIYFAGQTPEVNIVIYDVAANIVKTWDNVTEEKYKEWDGRNNKGDQLNSGVYIVHIKGIKRKDINEIIKMIIIR